MNTEWFTVVPPRDGRYLGLLLGPGTRDDDLDAFRGIALGIVVGVAFWALVALAAVAVAS